MKKLVILAIPLLALSACGKHVDASNQNIVCPTGAPAFAFYKQCQNPNFETNSVPKNIVAMMTETSNKDFVVIDTVSGVQAIGKGAPYKLAASLTFGNFFIASTGNDEDGKMDAGDKIAIFGKGATPDLLFHYIYGTTYDSGIEYDGLSNVQDAAKCLITGKNEATGSSIDYVFIAQPVLLNALAKNSKAAVYANIQEKYQEKSGGKRLIQASLFIKNSADKSIAKQFMKDLESDVKAALKNPDVITEEINKVLTTEESSALYGVNPELAVKAIKADNGLGLGYEKSYSIKADIDAFLKDIQGINETSEEIYYK